MENKKEMYKYIEDIIEELRYQQYAIRNKEKRKITNEMRVIMHTIKANRNLELRELGMLRYTRKKPVTYKKIGEELGVSHAKVYYLRRQLLEEMNENLKKYGLEYKGEE